jgi:hypothetical protein
MNVYMVFLKMDPNHTDEVVRKLQGLPKNPTPEINLHHSYYVFGTWDACIWFYANNHDDAMNFLQKYIRTIPWVTETYALPTTLIKEYK